MFINNNVTNLNVPLFFKESISSQLTDTYKKILIVVSLAFGCLAACYFIKHYCYKRALKAKRLGRQTKKEELLELISHFPNNSKAFLYLGRKLPKGGNIQLLDGTLMTKQELFLKAIQLDPTYPVIYNNLACCLPPGGSIQLLDGTLMTEQDLFLKAIQLNPTCSNAYERFKIYRGRISAYNNLAILLLQRGGSSIQLLDGTLMTKQDLCLKAIELDPDNPVSYNILACCLPPGGSIQLLDGTLMTEQDLSLKAIQLDPTQPVFYHKLAHTLLPGGSIQLLDGTLMTQQLLLLKAINLDSNYVLPYHRLGRIIPFGSSIQLLDGTWMTQHQLLSK